jgi:hypothetical protein
MFLTIGPTQVLYIIIIIIIINNSIRMIQHQQHQHHNTKARASSTSALGWKSSARSYWKNVAGSMDMM